MSPLPLRTDADHKLGAAFASILLMVSLHFLEGSKGDDRGQERCQHIFDLVETYGRMSGSGDGGENDEKDEDGEENGEPVRVCRVHSDTPVGNLGRRLT